MKWQFWRQGGGSKRPAKARANKKPKKTSWRQAASRQIPAATILTFTLVSLGVVALVGGAALWYSKIFTDPQRTFWDTLDNSLATRGVTREIRQEKVNDTSLEIARMSFGSSPGVELKKELKQSLQEGKVDIQLEGVGTPTDDYQRYTRIQRPSGANTQYDYSPVEGAWVHTNTGQNNQPTPAQLFSQTIFSGILFGNLPIVERHELLNTYLRDAKVYDIDYQKVKRTKQNGRPVYVYTARVNIEMLAKALRQYGRLTGLDEVAALNPDSYKNQQFTAVITIDVRGRFVRDIAYQNNSSVERYAAHGQLAAVNVPPDSIPVTEFSERLNKIEGQ